MLGEAAVEDPNDIRVVEAREDRDLALEALLDLWILAEGLGEELHRDHAPERHLLGLVDDPHPARADPLGEPAAADDFPN